MNWPVIEYESILVVSALFGMIFFIAELWRHLRNPGSEWTRKFVHFSGGFVALSFPYFFDSHWSILVLTFAFGAIIFVSKKAGFLKSVHAVERESFGGIYFPLAIYIVFVLSGSRWSLYLISILILTIADTCAALIGSSIGKIRYDVEGNQKSLEGSTSFFVIAFLCIYLPLQFIIEMHASDAIIISFIISLLVTGFEAISLEGRDNIWVPIGTYFLLVKMIDKSQEVNLRQIWILAIVILSVILLNRLKHTLQVSGVIGCILLGYAAWSLCGLFWYLPILFAHIAYNIFMHILDRKYNYVVFSFQVRTLLYTSLVPLLLVFASNAIWDFELLYIPFLAAIVAQVSIMLLGHLRILNMGSEKKFMDSPRKMIGVSLLYILGCNLAIAAFPVIWLFQGKAVVYLPLIIATTILSHLAHTILNRTIFQSTPYEIDNRLRVCSILVATLFAGIIPLMEM